MGKLCPGWGSLYMKRGSVHRPAIHMVRKQVLLQEVQRGLVKGGNMWGGSRGSEVWEWGHVEWKPRKQGVGMVTYGTEAKEVKCENRDVWDGC